ncbi:hypothetical protein LY76DRAFT_357840 [Colletotrichum caudatum]|nr:hypothetical protein LY76DRAFT_357840 [Colletotrichum caudatum]
MYSSRHYHSGKVSPQLTLLLFVDPGVLGSTEGPTGQHASSPSSEAPCNLSAINPTLDFFLPTTLWHSPPPGPGRCSSVLLHRGRHLRLISFFVSLLFSLSCSPGYPAIRLSTSRAGLPRFHKKIHGRGEKRRKKRRPSTD